MHSRELFENFDGSECHRGKGVLDSGVSEGGGNKINARMGHGCRFGRRFNSNHTTRVTCGARLMLSLQTWIKRIKYPLIISWNEFYVCIVRDYR